MKNSLSKRLLSLLLCLAMFLSLGGTAFAGALDEEHTEEPEPAAEQPEEELSVGSGDEINSNEPPSGRFNPYFRVADDMVGGTVTDSQNIYLDTSTLGKQITAGLRVTLYPHADAGYEFRGWSIVCKQNEEYYLDVDDYGDFAEFVVGGPYNSRYTFVIRAEFAYTGGGYPIDCYSVDATGLGSSISVDKTDAKVGETVSILVDRKPGTVFDSAPYAFFNTNESYPYSGGYSIPLTKESDSLYTFVVPEDITRYIKQTDQTIYVRAEFALGEYAVTVDSVSDPDGTGNTVTATEGAGLGDEVTVSVMMRYATAYGPEGLQVFWLDEEGRERPVELTLSGSSVSPYSSSGETTYTYTFAMPEHDVHVTADFVKIGHRISTAPVDVPGQTLRGRFFQGETNLSVSPNEQRAVAGDTITAEFHVDHEENMGSYGIRSAWITWEENGATQRRDLENVRYDEYFHFYGDFVMPDADVVLHAELERSWWVMTDHYSGFSLDPDKWEAFVGETVTVTANLIDEGNETFEGWTWHVVYYVNSQPVELEFTPDPAAPNRISFQMPNAPVSVSIESPYSYISRRWTGSRVEEDVKNPVEFRLISSQQDNENLTLTSGVWILSQSRSFSNRLTISGDVHLVLCDGATLTCGKGVELAPGNSLSVYGQEEDTGKLICTGPENHAGIGGGNNTGSGSFTIHGGTVTANGGDYAAGVGTGDEASPDSCGSFTMLGGSLTATGGTDGAGVGGGNEVKGGTVTVYDGSLTVKGGDYAAGIGGGDEADGGSVTIYNGTVKTTGGPDGAGIGGGEGGSQGGIVTIYDGTVTTTGGTNGAGIGGGGRGYTAANAGHGGSVYIRGGTVNVTAGLYAAGIGGGSARLTFTHSGNGGNVSISGGTITIDTGGQSGAGIGGGAGAANFGYAGNGGDVSISGGKLTINMFATRSAGIGGGGCDYECGTSGSVNISGGEISINISSGYIGELYVDSQGAGIGGAAEMDQGGDIRITGGGVLIKNDGYGAGIGGGASEKKPSEAGDGGNVYINNAYVVAASHSGAGIGGGGSLKGGGGGGNGGNVTIDGGCVYAISSNKGAGIGGGNDGNGGTLTVNGGYVMATGGYLDYNYIRDHGLWSDDSTGLEMEDQGWTNLAYNLIMHFISSGEYAGAGIGGGDDGDGGTVIINGGTVIAISGMNSASAFGRGDGGDSDGSLAVYPNAKVTYGTVSDKGQEIQELGLAPAVQRNTLPQQYAYARIEPCDHPNKECTPMDEHEHTVNCPNCGMSGQTEPHTFDETGKTCVDCGYERVLVTLLPGQGSGNAVTVYVTKGEQYTLPECSFTGPNGRSFSGWQGSVNGGEEAAYPAGSSFRLMQDLTLTAQWNDPYQLWVNGVRVTSDNQSDVLGGGTVVYDPETCTLTLNGPVFTDTHEGALIYADDLDLTITGSGVVSMDESFDTGVRILSGSLMIDGNISVAGAGANGLDADEDVILRSGVIAAQGGSYGIRAGRSIYVRRDIDRVTADGRRALSYQEIDVDPGVTVVERTSANRLPPEDEWDLESANHVVFDQGVVVSFVLNGGEMEGETGTVQHNIAEGMTVAKPEPDPTREGYTFSGWYTDEGLTLEFDFETELDEDISLYAKWNKAYPVEIQWEKGDELEQEPESVRVVLQRGRNGEWTTVAELTITAEDEWKGSLEYVPGPDALDSDEFRIREIDELTGLPVCDPNDDLYASDRPTAIFTVGGEQKGYLVSYKQIEEANYIINSSTKQYSVELSWDIDVGDQDRPDEIEVVLQKQEGKFSWKSVQVITLDPSNGWSGEFDTVPLGYVNDTETFVFYEYRVRELRPKTEEEQEEYGTEEERLEAADERVVHNTFDLDKPFIHNLLMTADPENLWTFDYTVKWLTTQAIKITIPPPTFTAEIDTYTDTFGKEIEEHESKYFIAYDHNSTSHHMKITNTAVLDIDIRKIWIGFEDDQMPESVYLMLMSKVDDDYAEQIGVSEINIYTPVATVVYGSQLNINTIPGVEEGISSGIKALLGDGFMSSAAVGTLSSVLTIVTNSGIAIVEAKGDGNNPLTNWRVTMMVKKYGSYGVPMEFAGAELITGLMEMAIDAIIKQLGIPVISCPVMYHPVYECWSIKGYAIPSLHDYSYTCNVINLKFDGDESEIKQISGTKTWVNDTEDQRPDEIVIHVYAKGEDGSRTEITGSPLTVTAENNWAWSMQIPLNDIAVVKVDGENSSVTYKEIEIEEEVPEGYEASYDGYNITNTYTGTKTVEGHKSWEDDNDADGLRPSSITIRLLADGEEIDARTVTAADDWAWSFPELPEYNASGAEIAYTITEDPVEGYISEIDGYNVTNTIVSRVYGYNVNLKGRIGLNVYLFIPQHVLQDSGLYVTLDDKSFPVASANTRVVDGLTLYQFSVDKAAKEMNDQVTVRLYRADGTPETLFWRDEDVTETGWRYSIQTYIDRSREETVEPLLLAVVNAMSDYGSLAQAYFHHNEENRAAVVGDVDAVTEAELAPYEAKVTQSKATGVTYSGSSLVLRSGTVIRHYFTIDEGSVGDYTFKIGSKTVTPVETENGWMIEIQDVYARNLDTAYTVTVTSSEGRILTLKYSALSYAYKAVQDNTDPALVRLVKAMYLYNRAADEYFS